MTYLSFSDLTVMHKIIHLLPFQNLSNFSKLVYFGIFVGSFAIVLGTFQETKQLFSNMANPTEDLYSVDFEVFGRVQGV